MIDPAAVTQLAERIRRITDAESSAHALKALLGASQSAVPRAGLFLVSQGKIQGWGSVGYPTDVAGAQRSYQVPADRGWLGALVRVADGRPGQRPDGDDDPDFGQAAPAEMIGCTLCIDNRPIAVLVGERTSDEMDARLFEIFDELRANPDVRAVIWNANGKSWSSGRDVGQLGIRGGSLGRRQREAQDRIGSKFGFVRGAVNFTKFVV